MDVGSLICKRRNPNCPECPLKRKCLANKKSIQNTLPNKSPKKAKPIKKLYWLILQNRKW
jgi:A/G-specific adenine glycosylase